MEQRERTMEYRKLLTTPIEAAGYIFRLPFKQVSITLGNMFDFFTDPDSEFLIRDLFFVKPKSRREQ